MRRNTDSPIHRTEQLGLLDLSSVTKVFKSDTFKNIAKTGAQIATSQAGVKAAKAASKGAAKMAQSQQLELQTQREQVAAQEAARAAKMKERLIYGGAAIVGLLVVLKMVRGRNKKGR